MHNNWSIELLISALKKGSSMGRRLYGLLLWASSIFRKMQRWWRDRGKRVVVEVKEVVVEEEWVIRRMTKRTERTIKSGSNPSIIIPSPPEDPDT